MSRRKLFSLPFAEDQKKKEKNLPRKNRSDMSLHISPSTFFPDNEEEYPKGGKKLEEI